MCVSYIPTSPIVNYYNGMNIDSIVLEITSKFRIYIYINQTIFIYTSTLQGRQRVTRGSERCLLGMIRQVIRTGISYCSV